MIAVAGYLGAAAMSAAPFLITSTIGQALAIVGLSLLTVQAIDLRAWNLVALNLIGVAGYTFTMIGYSL